MHAVDMPAVHPAADAGENLVPGLYSWGNSLLSNIAHLDWSKIPRDRAGLEVCPMCLKNLNHPQLTLGVLPPQSPMALLERHCLTSLSTTLPQQHWYANTEPLSSALTFASIFTVATFVLGELTQNWSYVDRVWAVLPVLYSAHLTFHDRLSGAGSVKGLFDWSSKPAAGDSAATWFSAFVPNGVNDRMFLVFLLQVGAPTLWPESGCCLLTG